LREPDAHTVGPVGAVKDQNAVAHDTCPLRHWMMHSNHAGHSHARPEPAANEPTCSPDGAKRKSGTTLTPRRISLRFIGLRVEPSAEPSQSG
jgi:hypothetical protein